MNAIAHHMSSPRTGHGARHPLARRAAARSSTRPAGPRPARTLRAAAVVLGVAAALELATLVTLAATRGSVSAAILSGDPHATAAQLQAASIELTAREIAGGVLTVLLAWLAWANGRGQDWARLLLCAVFALSGVGLLGALADHAATYAPAALSVGAATIAAQLAAVVLVFTPASARYYRRAAAR